MDKKGCPSNISIKTARQKEKDTFRKRNIAVYNTEQLQKFNGPKIGFTKNDKILLKKKLKLLNF